LVGSTTAATVTTGGPSATVDAAAQGHTHTVSGTVSKPTFTGTEGTVTVSGSVSGTTGTPA
jgi:hypothetical protein